MAGVGSFAYYLGLFLADLILYLPPLSMMVWLVKAAEIKPYSTSLDSFCLLAAGFGPCLISFTYLNAHLYKKSQEAVLSMVMMYLLLGTVIPMLFVTILWFTKNINMMVFYFHLFCFFTNPFYTFFVSNFSIFRKAQGPKYRFIKLTLSTDLTPWVGCRTMLI